MEKNLYFRQSTIDRITMFLIKNLHPMLSKLFCALLLLSDTRPTFFEKFKYFFLIISTFTPVVWLLEGISGWYVTNHDFANGIFISVFCNILIGGWYHHKMGTFSFEQFIVRNSIMILVLLFGYTILEIVQLRMGDNILAEGFKVVVEISTILYPGSKVLKNIYILSNKQFPPAFIMERLYNFQKSGNIKDLFPEEPNNN